MVNEWDFEKNIDYTPETITYASRKRVWWKCKYGHEWETCVGARTCGDKSNCPICSESKGEKRIEDFFSRNGIIAERQKMFSGCSYKRNLRFDFYIPNFNILIEYNGEQHYEVVNFGGMSKSMAKIIFEENKKKDAIKKKYCERNNIGLLEIPYWEFSNIKKILTKAINL